VNNLSENDHAPVRGDGDVRSSADEIRQDGVRYWLEFSCWTTLLLAPFLYWVNGPAVSTDQFVVRTVLVSLAAVGAVSLRACALFRQ